MIEELLVADVGDEHSVGASGSGLGNRDELLLKFGDADIVQGLELVCLVLYAYDGLVGTCLEGRIRYTRFGEKDDDLGFFGCTERSLDAKALDGVVGMTDAGGNDEAEKCSFLTSFYRRGYIDGVFDEVASGALYV